ncbi:MAG: Cys-tRNA(Pro) deacylase [Dehalococcoidia bacterium]|nr:Cys-tRNA(Pro) deacylase [Dehalococcoidia bacterium]
MTPAVEAARKAGIAFDLLEYEHDPSQTSFGLEAVEVLGLPGEQVFKTLVAEVDGKLAVGVVPVTAQLDLKALASAVGGRKAAMAAAGAAQRATGYVLGGISPLGQKRRLPTVVDESAQAFERVYVSAGRRGLEIALAPADLVALAGATFAPVARR